MEENEIVCKNCGVVFGFDETNSANTIPLQHLTNAPKINLYMKNQNGSNPYDAKKITKYKKLHVSDNTSSDLALFSAICDKLSLSSHVSEHCWRLYKKLKQYDTITRAKAACLAIYLVCRKNSIPYDEQQIRDAVCQTFGVKNAPIFKSIIFKLSKLGIILDTEDEDKTQHNNNSVTIASLYRSVANDSASKRQFYLNSLLSQTQKDLNLPDITILKNLTLQYYDKILLNDDSFDILNKNENHSIVKNTNYKTLAKRAVSLALQRCGLVH
jgi:hypothetical protein